MQLILYFIYFFLFLILILKHPFFDDKIITRLQFQIAFILKAICGYLTYRFYFHTQNSLPQGDVFSFFNDGEVLFSSFKSSPIDFLKLCFGFYTEKSSFDLNYLDKTSMWYQHFTTGYLNDNRYFIRLNSIFSLFSFHTIHIHFLFVNFLSFLGIIAIYKSFQNFFFQKEKFFFGILFLIPSALFWGSALLKESVVFFHLGFFVFFSFRFISKRSIWNFSGLLFFLFLNLILKPYVFISFVIPFFTFLVSHKYSFRISLITFLTASLFSILAIFLSNYLLNNKPVEAIVKKQYDFINLSKGGVFLLNDTALFRVEYAHKKNVEAQKSNNLFSILPNTYLQYWKLDNFDDTLFCALNESVYDLQKVWDIKPANSFFQPKRIQPSISSLIIALPHSVMIAFFRPNLWESKNSSGKIAGLESILILFFIILFWIFIRDRKCNSSFLFMSLMFTITLLAIIGLTVPVEGAIVRYRAPAFLFLGMLALQLLDVEKMRRLFNRNR